MSRQKDIRRALLLARQRDPDAALQQLATDRGGYAEGGVPYFNPMNFTPFVPPSLQMAQGTSIQPSAIAPPRPPTVTPPPTTTPPPSTGGGNGKGGEPVRTGKNMPPLPADAAVRMAQQIANKRGGVPGSGVGSAPLNSATGGGNAGFAPSPSTFPDAPGNSIGDTTSTNYGGAYASAPGFMGIGQALADNQAPAPGQIAGALAGLATGPAGLAVGALGMGLNALGAQPSQDPHGMGTGDQGEVGKSDVSGMGSDYGGDKGGDMSDGNAEAANSGSDMSDSVGGDYGGADYGGDDGGGGGESGGGSGAGDSSGEKARGGEVDDGARTYDQGFLDGIQHVMSGEAMAHGGRLLQDKYPSHYMPGVGRQVMADGGGIDPETGEPWTFDPSRIFAFADGGVVAKALTIAHRAKTKKGPRHV